MLQFLKSKHMMYGYGAGGMMNGWGALWGTLGFLTWFIWLTVGILLAAWLWKQIQKK